MRSARIRYAAAVAGVFAAAVIRILTERWIGNADPFFLYLVAVIAAGMGGGGGPALLATSLSIVVVNLLHLPPVGSFAIADPEQVILLVLFGIEGGLVALLSQWHRWSKEAAQARDDLLMNVSHELRTPLSAASGWVSMLRRSGDRLDAGSTDLGLAAIERSVGSLGRLVADLLDTSRVLSGKFRLNLAPTDLAAIVRNAVEAMRPDAEAKGVRLECATDPSVGTVMVDSGRMGQVLGNLLTNAVKFTSAGSRVRVTLEHMGDTARITVADEGRGLSPDALTHLFERFWQSDSARDSALGGMGLGLSLVRHLVEAHGGDVTVSSPGEGLGATFTVRLPLPPGR